MWNKADLYGALSAPDMPLLAEECSAFRAAGPTGWTAGQLSLVRARAEAYLTQPVEPIPYSVFRLYWETGDRATHHPLYFERRGRLFVFSLLCWLEPENPRWKAALEEIIWIICEEPFWCIPAHFLAPGDQPLPFEDYATQLDLFSCETAFALAEALALCRDVIAPDVVRQAELQIQRRVFDSFLDGAVFYRFEEMRSNWSGVCGGALGGAALHLVKDRAKLTSLLHRCLSCMDVYLSSFGDDGVCVEGVGYWTYGFGFFVCFADLLAKRTGGAINLLAAPKAAAIAQCQQHYFLAANHTVSFADGSPQGGFRMGLSCWLQKRFPAATLPDRTFADGVLTDNCYRYCLALRDFLWCDEAASFGLPVKRSVWLADAQWLISGGSRLVIAAKAGHNGESHNHNDCGSLILCKDGQPLICDLGAGLYDAAYFGEQRYSLFINASRSHNVPMPAGCEQMVGCAYTSREVSVSCGDTCDELVQELSACYDCPALTRLTRRLRHDKIACSLTLTDHAEFSSAQPFAEVFLSQTPITLEQGRARFSREGVTLALTFDESLFSASLSREDYPTHNDGHLETAYLLRLEAKSPALHHACIVTLNE